jgi:hypothetical protein
LFACPFLISLCRSLRLSAGIDHAHNVAHGARSAANLPSGVDPKRRRKGVPYLSPQQIGPRA